MTLDQLITRLPTLSADPSVAQLVVMLREWQASAQTPLQLEQAVERYLGNVWIPSDEEHRAVYAAWSSFRDQSLRGAAGKAL